MQIHQLMDACLFAVAFWLAYELRSDPKVIALFNLETVSNEFDAYIWLYVVLIPVAPLILEAQGFYSRPMPCSRRMTFWPLFKGCLFITLGLVLALFCFRMWIARWVVIWFGALSFALVFAKEELLRVANRSRFAQTQFRRRFVLVGASEDTARLRAELAANAQEDIEILEHLNLNDTPVQRLVELLHEHSVNGVILSPRHAYSEQIEAALRACELEGVEVWLLADFFRTQISRTSFDDLFGRPVLVFRTVPEATWQSVFKRVLDLVGAAPPLLVLLFLGPFLALYLKLTSCGPLLYRQKRAGLNGRPFTLYKFRTLVPSTAQLPPAQPAANLMPHPAFPATNGSRVTKLGRFLHQYSLEDWPQFYNVLRGEMSLVGPCPLAVDELHHFNDFAYRRRLSVKPGLTCIWQISGRNNSADFQERLRLDLEYIDNWSLWLDLKILCRTVPVVLGGNGAK
jgi:exopolysaccharide biosynthesis polyprenyl glycosylphosphotransferase